MEKASGKERKIALVVCLSVLGILGGVFVLESVAQFDIGRLFDPCGFKQRYRLPCITCGWTTATRAFARGELVNAFYIQPAAALVNCLMLVSAVVSFVIAVTGKIPLFVVRLRRELKYSHLLIVLVVVLLSGWAVTFTRAVGAR